MFSGNGGIKNHVWVDMDGNPLPFQGDSEIKDFLKTAEVISMAEIPEGKTDPKRLVLEKDGLQVNAVFRDVNIRKDRGPGRDGKNMLNFRDSNLYECAAFELSKLLGLVNVPPVVQREVKGTIGTVQIWVEETLMEKQRLKKKIKPPNPWRWMMQHQVLGLFDNLIHNDDRNSGNLLIDEHWNLWFIDHTRSFRRFSELPNPEAVQYCERELWERLQELDEAKLNAHLGEYLQEAELEAVLERKVKLVERISNLIAEKGEDKVLFRFF
jgi:hypothetical protein